MVREGERREVCSFHDLPSCVIYIFIMSELHLYLEFI